MGRLGTISVFALFALVNVQANTVKIDEIKKVECDRKTQPGDYISVHYRGTLESNGKEFDNSYKRNAPLPFTVGQNQVIQGWDQGLLGMCVGEERRLVIPPELGYGEAGFGDDIPPDSSLVFETKLVSIAGVA